MLGGLYRNTESKNIATLPWLTQAEDFTKNVLRNVVSGAVFAPISSTIGSRSTAESRRELVFLIKCETWRPSFTISNILGFESPLQETQQEPQPPDLIQVVPIDDPPQETPAHQQEEY